MEVEIDWGDLEKNVLKTIADVDGKIRRKAGKNAGHKLGERLEANTPENSRKLEMATTVGPVQENGDVLVGYGKSAYWRAHFVNMGTENQAGQHFIEKTVETEVQEVMQEYMKELKAGLKL